MELKGMHSICAIIVICAIIATVQAASAVPTISVEPSYMEVSPGDTFTVNITIDPDGTEVMGAQYTLYFDNVLLKTLNQDRGQFLSQDGETTNVFKNKIYNTLGEIKYSEARIDTDVGVTTPGVLSTIEFEVRCSGAGELRLGNVKLSSPGAGPISTEVNNATVDIVQSPPPTSFLISGYVSYANGSDCNDPAVNITNLNTSRGWTAGTSGNYYQLLLSSCADVVAGEILCFNVTGPDGSSNITEHTVTQTEVGGGGFELNITLEPFTPIVTPTITSCDEFGNVKDAFAPGEAVYVTGSGFSPNTNYALWIQNDPVGEGYELNGTEDPSGLQETVATEEDGSFGPIVIWSAIPAGSPMNYDIVVDNMNNTYNAADDGIDSASAVGIVAPIPELATFALIGIGLMLVVGLMRFGRKKR